MDEKREEGGREGEGMRTGKVEKRVVVGGMNMRVREMSREKSEGGTDEER